MNFPSVSSRMKWIVVIVVALAVCAPLAADDPEGKTYEATVWIVNPFGDDFAVACTCLTFEALAPNGTGCLRSASGLMALWSFADLPLVEGGGVSEVKATTGPSLPSICGGRGPRFGFEGFAFHGVVDGDEIALDVMAEVAAHRRLLIGMENAACSLDTCTIDN